LRFGCRRFDFAQGAPVISRGARPPAPFNGRLDDLLRVADGVPVELDIRILRFDLTLHIDLEGIAPDPHAAWRAEHVQDLRALARAIAIDVHEVRGLVPTLVADHSQERHGVRAELSAFLRS